ncbi:hypothetical protein [Spirosoma aerophilum]
MKVYAITEPDGSERPGHPRPAHRKKYDLPSLRLLFDDQTAMWTDSIPVVFTPSPIVIYTGQKPITTSLKWASVILLTLLAALLHPSVTSIDTTEIKRLNDMFSTFKRPASAPLPADPKWTYFTRTNQASGPVRWAELPSTNTLNFELPYNSGLRGYFALSKKPTGVGMMLRLEKGLFQAKAIVGHSVRLVLDEDLVQTLPIEPASVFQQNVVNIQARPALVASLKRAKTMRIEVQFYHERNKQLEFNVQGLKRDF